MVALLLARQLAGFLLAAFLFVWGAAFFIFGVMIQKEGYDVELACNKALAAPAHWVVLRGNASPI